MKLIQIRGEFEKCLGKALPDFHRFSARVTKLSEADLPCVNLFFHRDCLVKNQNIHEDREVRFEMEICFKPTGDAEEELSKVRKRIEDTIESSDALQNMITDWSQIEVDFAHDMVGNSRIAALALTYSVEYIRPLLLPPPPIPGPPKEVWANGEKIIG